MVPSEKLKVLVSEPTGGFWPYSIDFVNAISCSVSKVGFFTSKRRSGAPVDSRVDYFPIAREMNKNVSRSQRLRWLVDRVYTFLSWQIGRHCLLRKTRADILHLQGTYADFDRYFLPLLRGRVKIILTAHDVFPITTHSGLNKNSRALAKVYALCDGIIVHSQNNYTELLEHFSIDADKIAIIPHGADVETQRASRHDAIRQLKLDEQNRYLLVFGGLRESKGIDIAIDVFARASVIYSDLRLIIAGGADASTDLAALKKKSVDLAISDKILWDVRYVPDETTELYFSAASAALLPYRTFHSQSGVLLQAYRYGLPVCVTDVGALGETVRKDHTGTVAVTATAETFFSALTGLLAGSLEEYSQNQIDCIRREYNWHNIAKMTAEFYQKILAIKRNRI